MTGCYLLMRADNVAIYLEEHCGLRSEEAHMQGIREVLSDCG